ncbi:conserved Plasmodium protein, unknown function [Plasmodium sp. gorilla clade G2]|uniref:conserved Plasmodium protein, unknown function n=1 Tax=Plasmodium sp. gorilla clade G2 TaxID=880535 RepID=UPI000D22C617|nr:conserved Plasmodium protein, unknown function [Plasmodium sp. gorilla clade G2]SOV12668.1 conserved Plasmodium protein, unknown function [Plasmodium sp. gorilla clade G2]
MSNIILEKKEHSKNFKKFKKVVKKNANDKTENVYSKKGYKSKDDINLVNHISNRKKNNIMSKINKTASTKIYINKKGISNNENRNNELIKYATDIISLFDNNKEEVRNESDNNLNIVYKNHEEIGAFSNKNIKNTSETLNCFNESKQINSFEFSLEINNENNYHLSKHVKELINYTSNSEPYFSDTEFISENNKSNNKSNERTKKKKMTKFKETFKNKKYKKEKENIIIDYNTDIIYKNLDNLKSLYQGVHESTSFCMTKLMNSRIHVQKNIAKYDDILSEHSENILNKFDIFIEEDVKDVHESRSVYIDQICECFTYIMSITLTK